MNEIDIYLIILGYVVGKRWKSLFYFASSLKEKLINSCTV